MTIENDDDLPQDDAAVEEEEVVEEEGLEPEDEGDEGEAAASPKRGRLDNRLESLRLRAQQAEDERRELETQLRQFQQEHRQREQQLDQQAEIERLSQMTDYERLEYELQKQNSRYQQFEAQQQFMAADQQDRAAFSQLIQSFPELSKIAPQVEIELNTLRQQRGWNVPRNLVVATLLGMQALQAMQGQLGKQRKTGQENIRRQKTPTAGGQSDVPRRNRRDQSPRDRLEGLVF